MKEFNVKVNNTNFHCTCYREEEPKDANIDIVKETEKLLTNLYKWLHLLDTSLNVTVDYTDDCKSVVIEEVYC